MGFDGGMFQAFKLMRPVPDNAFENTLELSLDLLSKPSQK